MHKTGTVILAIGLDISRFPLIFLQATVRSLRSSAVFCPSFFRPRSTVNGLRSAFAFTLVELMVVVAVIGIMLGLLIPNIRTMREKAWTSHCQNNLRQYGVAMNQYMADKNGYFIYPGAGGGMGRGFAEGQEAFGAPLGNRLEGRNIRSGSVEENWIDYFIPWYLPDDVTLDSLSAGNSSVKVCPVILNHIKNEGNFFDPDSPNFKGQYEASPENIKADFEPEGNVTNFGKMTLRSGFTTYAINFKKLKENKKDIPEHVISFIDWNARDGWGADLSKTKWCFTGTNSLGEAVVQDTDKWTNAWWLTEVGFHHPQGNVYGANYVAMDGHVGWVGSNTISITNFTTGVVN